MLYMMYRVNVSLNVCAEFEEAGLHVNDTALPVALKRPNELWHVLKNIKASVNRRLCAHLLHETTQEQHGTEKHMVKWLKGVHNRICLGTLLQKHCVSLLNKGLTHITSGLAAYGLQYRDLEWFSRAAMVSAVLKVSSLDNCSMSSQCSNIDYWCSHVV